MAQVFEPWRVAGAEFRNRLAMAPVKTALADGDGLATASHAAYYRRRAAGGVALVILEPMFVDPRGREHPRQLGAHDDRSVAAMRAVVDAVHEESALVAAHLNHAGRAANPKVSGTLPEAPSAVTCPSTGATPEPMAPGRIEQVLAAYVTAAERVCAAGCDAVELQLGLGYLPAQFLSLRTNRRGDEWGGAAGRWRFVDRLVSGVRDAVGPGRLLIARLSADEKAEGGLRLEDAVELGHRLEGRGVDLLHVVTGSACDSPPWYYQHMALPLHVNEELASRIGAAVGLPVAVAGRLGDPRRIRRLIGDGVVDMVALGRPLLADPDLPLKMRDGRDDEVMGCGACLQGCLHKVKQGGPVSCLINPEVGHEGEAVPAASAFGERVVVVGGGPAGLQAALEGIRRGWEVVLLERQDHLGGQFEYAFATPGKHLMERPFRALVRAVESSPVDVRLGVEAGLVTVCDLEPDLVLLATGSRPIRPRIPGLEGAIFAADVLEHRRPVGDRVMVLGGGLVGIEIAELVAVQGSEVDVVELLDEVARDMEPVTRRLTLARLAELPVTIHTGSRLLRMERRTAVVRDEATGEERRLGPFDTTVVAVGHRSHDPLSAALREAGIRVELIGDARRPGQVLDATQDARRAAAAMA